MAAVRSQMPVPGIPRLRRGQNQFLRSGIEKENPALCFAQDHMIAEREESVPEVVSTRSFGDRSDASSDPASVRRQTSLFSFIDPLFGPPSASDSDGTPGGRSFQEGVPKVRHTLSKSRERLSLSVSAKLKALHFERAVNPEEKRRRKSKARRSAAPKRENSLDQLRRRIRRGSPAPHVADLVLQEHLDAEFRKAGGHLGKAGRQMREARRTELGKLIQKDQDWVREVL